MAEKHVTVVGAGAFGGWSALSLLRAGFGVTLVDAWGPGNSRSSSGDDTRIIRGCYGPNAIYTEMTAGALPVWRECERAWGEKLFEPSGALWLARAGDDSYERAAMENLRSAGIPAHALTAAEGRRKWPQLNWEGVEWGVWEPECGFLYSRRACAAVWRAFLREGGEYRQTWVSEPGDGPHVFACGPWLPALFPQALANRITPTRQEVFYFGAAAADASLNEDRFPAWVDNSAGAAGRFYGIPGNEWRGFKVATDVTGPRFDPTEGDRAVTAEGLARARDYAARRFPPLRNAPLAESRVCQYEMSADGDLIIDRLPGFADAWVVGGGSGHGFKLGPAVGEMVARMVASDGAAPESRFSLSRAWPSTTGVGERK